MSEKKTRAILFDLGDTLRVIRKDDAYSLRAKTRIAELLGTETDPEEFYRTVIEPRYDRYREWALSYYCEAPEKVLWTRWLAYDFPRERVEAAASELTYEYRKSKGERVVTDGGAETIRELCARGYDLAIVSDLVGVHEVDEWLDRDGLRPYFKSVQQSSISLIRKPHPALFYYALEELGVDAGEACFVGDNLNRDIVGAKAAGLGLTIGVRYPEKKPQEVTEENRPDRFITHFKELLDIFPGPGEAPR
ncbi:MAG: HAD-IIIA family hydrolase [Lachnospiraceae bacterium]|nr:HAD-IIIA family hydrolase [Lachnospiraceae bacterium]